MTTTSDPAANPEPTAPQGPRTSSVLALAIPVAVVVAVFVLVLQSIGGSDTPGQPPPASQPVAPRLEIPGGDERNTQRIADMREISLAMDAYRRDRGNVPDTRGNVHTLCRFGSDLGCVLRSIMGEVPQDPLGADQGYWYRSDGRGYMLIAQWEGNAARPRELACPNDLPVLDQRTPLICLTSTANQ